MFEWCRGNIKSGLFLFLFIASVVNVCSQSSNLVPGFGSDKWKFIKKYCEHGEKLTRTREGSITIGKLSPDPSLLSTLSIQSGADLGLIAELEKPLKKDQVYSFSFKLRAQDQDTNVSYYGVSFYTGKSKLSNDRIDDFGWHDLKPCEEHRFYPYLRLENKKAANGEWQEFSYFILAKGGEDRICIRRIPREGKPGKTFISLSDLALVHIGSPADQDKENLIINGDFEFYQSCPFFIYHSQFYSWQQMQWEKHSCIDARDNSMSKIDVLDLDKNGQVTSPTVFLGTVDLVCQCSNKYNWFLTNAYSGSNYAKLIMGSRGAVMMMEYLQSEIKSPLKQGVEYKLTFYYKRAPYSEQDVNRLGVKFSECAFSMDKGHHTIKRNRIQLPIPDYIVTDTVGVYDTVWQEYSLTFTAKGKEKYLTIGSFWNDNQQFIDVPSEIVKPRFLAEKRVWYFIDAVRLEEVQKSSD